MKLHLSVLVLFYFTSLFCLTKQEISNQSCEDFKLTPRADFDQDKYGGPWYVVKLLDDAQSYLQDCLEYQYFLLSSQWRVEERSINLNTRERQTIRGTMNYNPGNARYIYDEDRPNMLPEDVTVIYTDKDYSMALEWACISNGNGSKIFFYELFREPTPDPRKINELDKIARNLGLPVSKTRKVVQDDRKCGRRTVRKGKHDCECDAEEKHKIPNLVSILQNLLPKCG